MDGIRVCARPNSTEGSCPGVLYHASRQYSKVCGRVIGYQFGSPSAFENEHLIIDEAYVEGVSITHGRNPRKHIWSYAAGSSDQNGCSHSKCPYVNLLTIMGLTEKREFWAIRDFFFIYCYMHRAIMRQYEK